MYLALILVVLLENPDGFFRAWEQHFWPFAILNLFFVIILYNFNFYSRRFLPVSIKFSQVLLKTLAVNTFVSITFFYLIGSFGISPKSNLLLYLIFFAALFIIWRDLAGRLLVSRTSTKTLLIDGDERTQNLFRTPDLRMACVLADSREPLAPLLEERYDLIVVDNKSYLNLQNQLYPQLFQQTPILNSTAFWEEYFRKIPLEQVSTYWLLNGLRDLDRREYETVKRIFDFSLALLIGVIFSWLILLIMLAIKLLSPGQIFFRQVRLGKKEKPFTVFKFRSMIAMAEPNGAQWSGKNDYRVTPLGKILRHTHLDELPQLWNILKGQMSFVGPRPERPEFIPELKAQIPHYALRHLAKPGLTGWAQINYRYGDSVADAKEKMSFDLYYVKNRSFLLDIKIILKTAAMLFKGEGR
ncbi:exopolysaccharide biosynthesis polyprenyl glycosylphosphotransferase [Patescibacteria group bacterium]|nr:exopolysaccharide biosynthesis polyprenyl glycosylphosphotransferase [Patescibacteria group bacterium]MBU1705832.1 exopolysaccharide biosynthesis polyprenyl glycosylphosphotransferase [Patescibacteria group bacterium]